MHSLLKRQLHRSFGSSFLIPNKWQGFIHAVNEAYWESDIDRKMLERSLDLSSQELLQTNSEMRAVFQAIPDMLLELDNESTIVKCKAGSTSDLLLQPKELLGRRIQDISLMPLGSNINEAIRQVKETKSIVSVEHSFEMEDKKHFYEVRLVPLLEDRIIAIIRNITERKILDDALMDSEEKYRNLVERANDAIIIIQDGIIRYANMRSAEMWHSNIEDIIGKQFIEFIDPKEIPKVVERYKRRMANQHVETIYETLLKR
jgi:PAS domain-containing protein